MARIEQEQEEDRVDNDDELDIDVNDDDHHQESEKWKKHYSSKQRILLVGEGDFSFSLCLATAFGSAHNLVATSLDSQGQNKSNIFYSFSSLASWKKKKDQNLEMPIWFFLAENLAKKYSNGLSNVRELEAKGCLVLHSVDAKDMCQHFFLKTQRFDRIVYNFPHVGFLYPENSYCQIQ